MLRQPQRSRRGPATAARGPLSPQFGMRASRRIEHTCAKRLGPVEAKRTTRFHGADLHFACAVRGTAPPKTVPRGRDSASGLRGGPCRRQPIFGPVGESLRLWQEGCVTGWTAMLRQPQRSLQGRATTDADWAEGGFVLSHGDLRDLKAVLGKRPDRRFKGGGWLLSRQEHGCGAGKCTALILAPISGVNR